MSVLKCYKIGYIDMSKELLIKTASIAIMVSGLILATSIAKAQSYRRANDARITAAPQYGQTDDNERAYSAAIALNGYEVPPYAYGYAYGYAYNLPSDGNWRFIERRCYGSANGTTCVDAHWVRHKSGQCEETSAHSVRSGSYIRIVPAGRVSSCRPGR